MIPVHRHGCQTKLVSVGYNILCLWHKHRMLYLTLTKFFHLPIFLSITLPYTTPIYITNIHTTDIHYHSQYIINYRHTVIGVGVGSEEFVEIKSLSVIVKYSVTHQYLADLQHSETLLLCTSKVCDLTNICWNISYY